MIGMAYHAVLCNSRRLLNVKHLVTSVNNVTGAPVSSASPMKFVSTVIESSKESLVLTSNAEVKINDLAASDLEDKLVRLEVQGGGCSGFQYQFNLTSKVEDDDCVIESNGAKLIVDKTSLELIKGSTVDYKEELIRNAFVVSHNPNAESGCSCGASFMIKSS